MKIPIILLALFAIVHGSHASDTIIASPASTYGGRTLCSSLTRAHIKSSPLWNSEEEEYPPLSPMKAKEAAMRILESIVPRKEIESEWRLASITLSPSTYSEPGKPKWVYFVNWTGPRIGYRTDTGEFVTTRTSRAKRLREVRDQFRLIVLMNGQCIEPREFKAPNKSVDHISGSR